MSAATEDVAALAEATAGFSSVRDDAPAVPAVVEAPKVEAVVEATPEPAKTETEPAKVEVEPPPMFAGYSKEQIDAVFARVGEVDTLAKQLRAAQGKIGELNGKLQEFAKPAPLQEEVLPPENEQRIKDYHAALIAGDDETAVKLFPRMGGKVQPGMSPEEVRASVAAATADLRKEIEIERLDEMHSGWNELIAQDGYKAYLATQSADVQEAAATTGSAKVLGKIISDYKAAIAAPNRNKTRLEMAVTPSGVPQRGSPAPTPLDEAQAGYESVRGRRQ